MHTAVTHDGTAASRQLPALDEKGLYSRQRTALFGVLTDSDLRPTMSSRCSALLEQRPGPNPAGVHGPACGHGAVGNARVWGSMSSKHGLSISLVLGVVLCFCCMVNAQRNLCNPPKLFDWILNSVSSSTKGLLADWTVATDPCVWSGVTCVDGCVSTIDLTNVGLTMFRPEASECDRVVLFRLRSLHTGRCRPRELPRVLSRQYDVCRWGGRQGSERLRYGEWLGGLGEASSRRQRSVGNVATHQ